MTTPLHDVRGIGPATIATLNEHGIRSAEDLAALEVDTLLSIPGFSSRRAQSTLESARTMLAMTAPEQRAETTPGKLPREKELNSDDQQIEKKTTEEAILVTPIPVKEKNKGNKKTKKQKTAKNKKNKDEKKIKAEKKLKKTKPGKKSIKNKKADKNKKRSKDDDKKKNKKTKSKKKK